MYTYNHKMILPRYLINVKIMIFFIILLVTHVNGHLKFPVNVKRTTMMIMVVVMPRGSGNDDLDCLAEGDFCLFSNECCSKLCMFGQCSL
mmetsp:Transcript_19083/g.26446  ORF Transcript_19083/g.26446 Transcript_19083/m.26446 type:complete len:90 (+) Transcript_19083:639-908(+)